MPYLRQSKGGIPEALGVITATSNSWVEMGKDYYGFCDQAAQDVRWIGHYMGNSWQTDEIRSFPANKRILQDGEIDKNIHSRNRETSRSASVYHLR